MAVEELGWQNRFVGAFDRLPPEWVGSLRWGNLINTFRFPEPMLSEATLRKRHHRVSMKPISACVVMLTFHITSARQDDSLRLRREISKPGGGFSSWKGGRLRWTDASGRKTAVGPPGGGWGGWAANQERVQYSGCEQGYTGSGGQQMEKHGETACREWHRQCQDSYENICQFGLDRICLLFFLRNPPTNIFCDREETKSPWYPVNFLNDPARLDFSCFKLCFSYLSFFLSSLSTKARQKQGFQPCHGHEGSIGLCMQKHLEDSGG